MGTSSTGSKNPDVSMTGNYYLVKAVTQKLKRIL